MPWDGIPLDSLVLHVSTRESSTDQHINHLGQRNQTSFRKVQLGVMNKNLIFELKITRLKPKYFKFEPEHYSSTWRSKYKMQCVLTETNIYLLKKVYRQVWGCTDVWICAFPIERKDLGNTWYESVYSNVCLRICAWGRKCEFAMNETQRCSIPVAHKLSTMARNLLL